MGKIGFRVRVRVGGSVRVRSLSIFLTVTDTLTLATLIIRPGLCRSIAFNDAKPTASKHEREQLTAQFSDELHTFITTSNE